jgi:hypothetical protein
MHARDTCMHGSAWISSLSEEACMVSCMVQCGHECIYYIIGTWLATSATCRAICKNYSLPYSLPLPYIPFPISFPKALPYSVHACVNVCLTVISGSSSSCTTTGLGYGRTGLGRDLFKQACVRTFKMQTTQPPSIGARSLRLDAWRTCQHAHAWKK